MKLLHPKKNKPDPKIWYSWNLIPVDYGSYVLQHLVLDIIMEGPSLANIQITDDDEYCDAWIQWAMSQNQSIFGIDLEWKPVYVKGVKTRISLIQLCVKPRNGCLCVLLFRTTNKTRLPAGLKSFLENPMYMKFGIGLHGLNGDLHQLLDQFDVNMRSSVDLFDKSHKGLKKTVSKEFGPRSFVAPTYKKLCCSNWDARYLSDGQIMYASLDAIYGERLGRLYIERGIVDGHNLRGPESAKEKVEQWLLESRKSKRRKARRSQQRKEQAGPLVAITKQTPQLITAI